MSNVKRDPISAMAFAEEVAAEYREISAGFRKKLYNFFGLALKSYRKFLSDEIARKFLLDQDNISRLREKPSLEKTSRLLLYFLIDPQNEAERNTVGKYARVVDYLHKKGVDNAAAADYVEANGIEEILKKARGRELKAADETQQDKVGEGEEDLDEDHDPASSEDGDFENDLFNPERDLSIRVGPETLEQILSSQIDVGESFYLECRKTGSVGDDEIRIVGLLVDLESA